MNKPFVSYITFNRLGLTVKSLPSILSSSDDFELHIIDCNSKDGTWEYLQSLEDCRITSRTQLPVNAGQVYAINQNLLIRQPDQYFINLDNDVIIETKDWISRFQRIFDTFPQVGMLSVLGSSPEKPPPLTPIFKDDLFYLELNKDYDDHVQSYIPIGCMALRPNLIKEIGYWSEENYFGHRELLFRVNRFTSFKVGLQGDIAISIPQEIDCSQCPYKNQCQLDQVNETCFSIYQKFDKNNVFKEQFKWKFDETVKDLLSGARPVYCPSLLDERSMLNNVINKNWATENIQFFVNNAN